MLDEYGCLPGWGRAECCAEGLCWTSDGTRIGRSKTFLSAATPRQPSPRRSGSAPPILVQTWEPADKAPAAELADNAAQVAHRKGHPMLLTRQGYDFVTGNRYSVLTREPEPDDKPELADDKPDLADDRDEEQRKKIARRKKKERYEKNKNARRNERARAEEQEAMETERQWKLQERQCSTNRKAMEWQADAYRTQAKHNWNASLDIDLPPELSEDEAFDIWYEGFSCSMPRFKEEIRDIYPEFYEMVDARNRDKMQCAFHLVWSLAHFQMSQSWPIKSIACNVHVIRMQKSL